MRASQRTTFWLYAVVSAAFWLVVWLSGWDFASEGSRIHIGWEGAVVNLVLLVPLWRRAIWAWHVLAIEALIGAVVLGSALGESYGLLALVAVAQLLLLWRLRTPRERVPEPRSMY